MTSMLFVCLGNICRSPMAEGLARKLVRERGLSVRVDSAGTAAYHVGELADPRTRAVLAAHDASFDGRARQVADADFTSFDLILAMDHKNHADLLTRCPAPHRHKVRLVLEPTGGGDVADPYYGGPDGFEVNRRQLEAAIGRWLERAGAP